MNKARKMQKLSGLFLLPVMCALLLFSGCGKKKPLTAEEFAAAVRNPEKAEAFLPAREPLTIEEYEARMKENMECNIVGVTAMGTFGYGGFEVYENEEEAKSSFAEGMEYWIHEYGLAENPYLAGITVKQNETAQDHDTLLLQSEYAYIRMSRVGNTIMVIRIVNDDVEKWTKVFEEAFEGTGY